MPLPSLPIVSGGLKKRLWAIIILVAAYLVYITLGDLIPGYWNWVGFRSLDRSILTLGFVVILLLCLSGLAMSDRLTAMAIRDGLTGLYNEDFIKARLREELDRSERYRAPMSLLMIDLDDFRTVNQRFGRVAGDRIIKGVGERLLGMTRASDVIGRFGGETFLLILPHTACLDAASVAERVRKDVAATDFPIHPRGDRTCRVTLSCGVYSSPYRSRNPEEILGLTDAALGRAKSEGKNKVVVFLK